LCCFSTSVYCCFYFVIDSVRELLDTPSYSDRYPDMPEERIRKEWMP